jgi:arginine decarboxylase
MIGPKKAISAPYYSIGQLRLDRWNELKIESEELAKAKPRSAAESKHKKVIGQLLSDLAVVEKYFAIPGRTAIEKLVKAFDNGDYSYLGQVIASTTRKVVDDVYSGDPNVSQETDDKEFEHELITNTSQSSQRNYFEVMFLDNLNSVDEIHLHEKIRELHDPYDQFTYNIVVQHSFQDALIALIFNPNIQAVVIRYAPPYLSTNITPLIKPYIQNVLNIDLEDLPESELGPKLGQLIKQFRPELDTYYVTDTALGQLKDTTLSTFERIFYRKEDLQELHLGIIRGVSERYNTPFFSALKEYSQKPTGVFHAMPISRGNSVFKSKWIKDFGEFYGRNMFLAETSSTTGGMDSLLQPTGPLKKAQEMASEAYGSLRTFFVTNGTSTANKIVLQALVAPGDLVLIDRDCHKSHHYGLVLSGAFPVYLDSYPIEKYSIYGAVPLEQIIKKLLVLKSAGRLDKVKMLLLTNCTFDGMVYNVQRVMERVLAIKPDMTFLWDEAWFAFAGFTYTYKQRTGMFSAKKLHDKYQTAAYRKEYQNHIESLKEGEESSLQIPI